MSSQGSNLAEFGDRASGMVRDFFHTLHECMEDSIDGLARAESKLPALGVSKGGWFADRDGYFHFDGRERHAAVRWADINLGDIKVLSDGFTWLPNNPKGSLHKLAEVAEDQHDDG